MTPAPDNPQNGHENVLTGMSARIHCGGSADGDTPEHGGDLDALMIDHFLDTLADIATAVAQRACKGES